MIKKVYDKSSCSFYQILEEDGNSDVIKLIVTTPETRKICNDPFVVGVEYTRMLQKACSSVFKGLREKQILEAEEMETIVFNILRGGLNFGLREALADAYDWNRHGSAFISAQRARISLDSEQWHITESHYKKVYVPKIATAVVGDVVATGTSLKHALNELVKAVRANGAQLKNLVFFTIGGIKSEEIIKNIDSECRKIFPEYEKSVVIYFEGRFNVAGLDSDLYIRITGTDLLRLDSLMAPEFVDSQYESPSYPLERCTIYDAGSRAFWLPEYFEDIEEYWRAVLNLAESGVSFEHLMNKRFPTLNSSRFGDVDLTEISKEQLKKLDR